MRAALVALALLAGCGGAGPPGSARGRLEGGAPRPVGLLGLRAAPATATVSHVDAEGRELHTGGLIVRDLLPGSPLADQVAPGDVLVAVGETPLPNRADPTLDLVRLVEEAHSGGRRPIPLGVLRGGTWRAVELRLAPDLAPIEAGHPAPLVRLRDMARRARARLAALQLDDGSLPCASGDLAPRVTVTAAAGLAFLAGDDAELRATAGARALEFVRGALADDQAPLDPWSPGLATWLGAEVLAAAAGPDPEAARGLAAAVGRLVDLQGEDGGWPLDGVGSGPSERTLPTHLALLALAAARRAGAVVSDPVLVSGLAYLKTHTHGGRPILGVPSGLDRRSEAGRAAGSLAALGALGCPRTDPFLRALDDLVDRHGAEIGDAPAVPELHLLAWGLRARQRGGGAWDGFVTAARGRLVALQAPDGTWLEWPRPRRLPFEPALGGPAWPTALGALLLALQEDRLVVGPGRRRSPLAPPLDSDGAPVETPPTGLPGTLDPGNLGPGQVITLDDPAELQRLLEQLGLGGGEVEFTTVRGKKEDD